jgi:hypothetical protein
MVSNTGGPLKLIVMSVRLRTGIFEAAYWRACCAWSNRKRNGEILQRSFSLKACAASITSRPFFSNSF